MAEVIFVDTDNAMGSATGDPDDAYAIAALIRAGAPITAIAAVEGNASEEEVHRNNERLCQLLAFGCPLLRGRDARHFLHAYDGRMLCLGPLTHAALAPFASEVIAVGGRLHSVGRWPPLWPHEFNLTHDRAATLHVFNSSVPLTLFPLDVARKLWVSKRDLHRIAGRFGEYARAETERWFRFLARHRWTTRFAIYDLTAALYAIDPVGFQIEETMAVMKANTFLRFGRGSRPVRVCRDLDRGLLLDRFFGLVQSEGR